MATARDQFIATVARRTNPRTGRPYGKERAAAIVNRAAERRRVLARQRRVLAAVDRQIARRGGKPPAKKPATPSERTVRIRHTAQQEHADALRSWNELRTAIHREGGIHPNVDFAASEIPREIRAKKGYGLAPDETPTILTSHGFHFSGDDELIQEIQRRRQRVHDTHEAAVRTRSRTGPSIVCVDACRDELGMFERCELAARRAVRYCRRRLRDAIGRFRAGG